MLFLASAEVVVGILISLVALFISGASMFIAAMALRETREKDHAQSRVQFQKFRTDLRKRLNYMRCVCRVNAEALRKVARDTKVIHRHQSVQGLELAANSFSSMHDYYDSLVEETTELDYKEGFEILEELMEKDGNYSMSLMNTQSGANAALLSLGATAQLLPIYPG